MNIFDRNLELINQYINELISSNVIIIDSKAQDSLALKIAVGFTNVYESDIFRDDYLYLLKSYSYKQLKMLYK